jgi:hypothetical protein
MTLGEALLQSVYSNIGKVSEPVCERQIGAIKKAIDFQGLFRNG